MSHSFLKYVFTALSSLSILCLDQATKIFIHTQVPMGHAIIVIKDFFDIAPVRNSGGAFGLFNDSSVNIRFVLFIIFPIICVGLLLSILRQTQHKIQIVALSFILGGAMGNYLDRIRLGYVVDFIDWHIKSWHWPIFNLADTFIVIGVAILVFFYIKEPSLNQV